MTNLILSVNVLVSHKHILHKDRMHFVCKHNFFGCSKFNEFFIIRESKNIVFITFLPLLESCHEYIREKLDLNNNQIQKIYFGEREFLCNLLFRVNYFHEIRK